MSQSRPSTPSYSDKAKAYGTQALRTTSQVLSSLASTESPNYHANFSAATAFATVGAWEHLFGCSTVSEISAFSLACYFTYNGARQANIGDINAHIQTARGWLEDKIYKRNDTANVVKDNNHPLAASQSDSEESISEKEQDNGLAQAVAQNNSTDGLRQRDTGNYGDYTGATLKR